MSVMDEDPDAVFMQIMEGVELAEPTDAIEYRTLGNVDLSNEYHRVRKALFDMDKLHEKNPTGLAADLHSQFSAINHELRRRFPQFDEKD